MLVIARRIWDIDQAAVTHALVHAGVSVKYDLSGQLLEGRHCCVACYIVSIRMSWILCSWHTAKLRHPRK